MRSTFEPCIPTGRKAVPATPELAGRSKHWIKVKNRQHPAMERVMQALG
jgi:hypothetical protein